VAKEGVLMVRILVAVALLVSDKGGKFGFVYKSRQAVYEALRRKGFSKEKAARISNAGKSHGQRSRMSKKAARSRKRRGR
jgi:hypothetical protein